MMITPELKYVEEDDPKEQGLKQSCYACAFEDHWVEEDDPIEHKD